MKRNWLSVVMALSLLALGIAPAWAQQQAPQMQRQQAAPQIQQQIPKQQIAPGQCTSPDRVAATALSLNPPQPKQGQTVTATLTIKNVCNGPLASVPWTIEVGTGSGANQLLGSGTQQNVPAGASFNVTANWTAVSGQRGFLGTADPNNTLHESSNQNRLNNYKDLPVNVPQMSADTQGAAGTPAPKLVIQLLDYQKAKVAGARFGDGLEGASQCNFGQCNWRDGGCAGGSAGHGDGHLFRVGCTGAVTGARGNQDAFTNFTLKNGWKVKSVELTEIQKTSGSADWSWNSRPSVGATSPAMSMHLWSNPFAEVAIGVKITIEGPENASPYE